VDPGWDVGPERRIDDGRTSARGLAWFSIALGAFELLAAEKLTDFLGVDERHDNLIRAYGCREIASGVAIPPIVREAVRHTCNAIWNRCCSSSKAAGSTRPS
jgi:hypothetical protein